MILELTAPQAAGGAVISVSFGDGSPILRRARFGQRARAVAPAALSQRLDAQEDHHAQHRDEVHEAGQPVGSVREEGHTVTILTIMVSLLFRVVALVIVSGVLLVPAQARADGDPASDTLLREDVYFPYSPPVSEPFGQALVKLLEDAKKLGFPIKVALIQTPADLGSYPQLFNNMQEYTNLLHSSLPAPNAAQHGVESDKVIRLLVIMPAGFGGQNLGDGVDKALAPVKVDTDRESDGLAQAAMVAVARLATENGFPLDVPPEATAVPGEAEDDGGSSPASALVYIAPLILVLGGAILAGRAARRRSEAEAGASDSAKE